VSDGSWERLNVARLLPNCSDFVFAQTGVRRENRVLNIRREEAKKMNTRQRGWRG
jgi:hypothetical protein